MPLTPYVWKKVQLKQKNSNFAAWVSEKLIEDYERAKGSSVTDIEIYQLEAEVNNKIAELDQLKMKKDSDSRAFIDRARAELPDTITAFLKKGYIEAYDNREVPTPEEWLKIREDLNRTTGLTILEILDVFDRIALEVLKNKSLERWQKFLGDFRSKVEIVPIEHTPPILIEGLPIHEFINKIT